MRFARFESHGHIAYGVVDGEFIRQIAGSPFTRYRVTDRTHRLPDVRLLAPCVPTKVVGLASNYVSHLGQVAQRQAPSKPESFLKAPSCIIGPGEFITIPKGAAKVDAEGELVVVMGKRCQKVSRQEALSYVLGYTCGNDVSARDWQQGDLQWWRAKGSDTFGPLGPYILTDADPANLDLAVRVNGKEAQHGNARELIFDVPALICFISQFVTLEPGDLIFTGTPGTPPQLHPGDIVEVEIPGIGVLRNPVREES